MRIFFTVFGILVTLISIIQSTGAYKAMNDIDAFDTLKKQLEEQGIFMTDKMLLESLRRTFNVSTVVAICSIIFTSIAFVVLR